MAFCPNCGTQYDALPVRCQCGYLFGTQQGAFQAPALAPSYLPPPAAASQPGYFEYGGQGGELLMLYLKLFFLSIFTLGIYSFWGRTEIRKYHWSRTSFAKQPFDYHGTGKELFFGWLKVIGIYVGFYAVMVLLALTLGQEGAILIGVIVALGFLAFLPFAIWGSIRYRASRTSWQGRRFAFKAQFAETAKVFWIGALLTLVTLGLYMPFFLMSLRKHVFENLWYGGQKFEFTGEGRDLLWPFLKFALLLVPTLTLYRFWFEAEANNYAWSKTKFAGSAFRSTMTGLELLMLFFTNWLLTVFTFGIGFAWAEVRQMKYVFANLQMEELPNVRLLEQAGTPADGFGDSLGHAIGTDADMGAGFGL
jgi:uncharacterized membrane protein YjgN (DUF898 family)